MFNLMKISMLTDSGGDISCLRFGNDATTQALVPLIYDDRLAGGYRPLRVSELYLATILIQQGQATGLIRLSITGLGTIIITTGQRRRVSRDPVQPGGMKAAGIE